MNEILENDDFMDSEGTVPEAMKPLVILSHVANGIFGLIFLLSLATLLSAPDQILLSLQESDPSLYEQFGDDLLRISLIIFGMFLVLVIVSFVGVLKMSKGKKSGFIIYAIANGIWSFFFLISMSAISIVGLIGLLFIFLFNKHAKGMS